MRFAYSVALVDLVVVNLLALDLIWYCNRKSPCNCMFDKDNRRRSAKGSQILAGRGRNNAIRKDHCLPLDDNNL